MPTKRQQPDYSRMIELRIITLPDGSVDIQGAVPLVSVIEDDDGREIYREDSGSHSIAALRADDATAVDAALASEADRLGLAPGTMAARAFDVAQTAAQRDDARATCAAHEQTIADLRDEGAEIRRAIEAPPETPAADVVTVIRELRRDLAQATRAGQALAAERDELAVQLTEARARVAELEAAASETP